MPNYHDLPNKPGHWKRDEGEWDVLVQQSKCRRNRLSVAGFRGRLPLDVEYADTGLPTGNWYEVEAVSETGNTPLTRKLDSAISRVIDEFSMTDTITAAAVETLRAAWRESNAEAVRAWQQRAELAEAIIKQHDLCHDLHGKVGPNEFAEGCVAEQRKLYGCAPHADKIAKLEAELAAEREKAADADLLLGDSWQEVVEIAKREPSIETALRTQITKLAGDILVLKEELAAEREKVAHLLRTRP